MNPRSQKRRTRVLEHLAEAKRRIAADTPSVQERPVPDLDTSVAGEEDPGASLDLSVAAPAAPGETGPGDAGPH